MSEAPGCRMKTLGTMRKLWVSVKKLCDVTKKLVISQKTFWRHIKRFGHFFRIIFKLLKNSLFYRRLWFDLFSFVIGLGATLKKVCSLIVYMKVCTDVWKDIVKIYFFIPIPDSCVVKLQPPLQMKSSKKRSKYFVFNLMNEKRWLGLETANEKFPAPLRPLILF